MSKTRDRDQTIKRQRNLRARQASGPCGIIDVLSTGHGHMKVTITPGDQAEQDKARVMIEDMLARGYSIFVETKDGETRRVKRFDPKKLIYYVDPPTPAVEEAAAPVAPRKRRRLDPVPVVGSRATAVGRSAGG